MPKLVDHETRRRELAGALWRVIREQGMHAASVRTVAAASGWSAGAVRHYFSTQDELLRFAVELLMERVPDRLRAVLAAPGRDGFARAVGIVEQFLPMDDERLGEVLVWLAFTDRARFDPELGRLRQAGWDGTRAMARVAVAELAGVPHPPAFTDPLPPALEPEAVALHVLIDGLCLQGISYPDQVPPAVLHAIVERELGVLRDRVP